MRAELNRHVLLDELPEKPAQRPVRRRAGGRQLRVKPQMRCVWVEAYRGSQRIPGGVEAMTAVPAVDQRSQGRSSWLRVAREKAGENSGIPKGAG